MQGQFGVIPPAETDCALLWFIEAADEVNNGGLSAAGWPDQGYGFALAYGQVEVFQNGFTVFVVEVHVIELDVGLDRTRICRAGPIYDLRHGINQRESPFRGGDG